jgi:hypothetical protein
MLKYKLYMIEPAKEDSIKKQKYSLKRGHSYQISDQDSSKAFSVFLDQVLGGKHGLYITRTNPDIIRRETPLKKTPILWLTEVSSENTINPSKIEEISFAITSFINTAQDCVILIEGIPYIASYSDFNVVLRLIRTLKDEISKHDSTLIVAIGKASFDANQSGLMNGELEELET